MSFHWQKIKPCVYLWWRKLATNSIWNGKCEEIKRKKLYFKVVGISSSHSSTKTTKKESISDIVCECVLNQANHYKTCHFQTSSSTRYSLASFFRSFFLSLFLYLCLSIHFQTADRLGLLLCCQFELLWDTRNHEHCNWKQMF